MLDKEFIDSQKQIILDQISILETEVKATKYVDQGSTGDENVSEFEDFEEKVALGNQAKEELKGLKSALSKIEKGNYGICEKCLGPIEKGRLKAFPASRFCATDAK